jgi:hypothetical protein
MGGNDSKDQKKSNSDLNQENISNGSNSPRSLDSPQLQQNTNHISFNPNVNANQMRQQQIQVQPLQMQQIGQYTANQMINSYDFDNSYQNTAGTQVDRSGWLTEDEVGAQKQKDISDAQNEIKKKYMNLNLSDLMSMNMVSLKDKLKLSEKEQDVVMKLSVNETKLEELEKAMMDEENNDDEATVDLFVVIDISYSMEGQK